MTLGDSCDLRGLSPVTLGARSIGLGLGVGGQAIQSSNVRASTEVRSLLFHARLSTDSRQIIV